MSSPAAPSPKAAWNGCINKRRDGSVTPAPLGDSRGWFAERIHEFLRRTPRRSRPSSAVAAAVVGAPRLLRSHATASVLGQKRRCKKPFSQSMRATVTSSAREDSLQAALWSQLLPFCLEGTLMNRIEITTLPQSGCSDMK